MSCFVNVFTEQAPYSLLTVLATCIHAPVSKHNKYICVIPLHMHRAHVQPPIGQTPKKLNGCFVF